jgi:hypothetical protein
MGIKIPIAATGRERRRHFKNKMTAIASDIESLTQKFIHEDKQYKIRLIQNLPDAEFWKLVADRLNRPVRPIFLSPTVVFENKNREYWTEEYLTEQIFLQLAGTEQTIVRKDNYKKYTCYNYQKSCVHAQSNVRTLRNDIGK